MAKINRSLTKVAQSQHETEAININKFASIEHIVQPAKTNKALKNMGRISPQLSCTIAQEDKDLLDKLALYACNKKGKLLTMSTLIRGLIKLGNKYKEELEF